MELPSDEPKEDSIAAPRIDLFDEDIFSGYSEHMQTQDDFLVAQQDLASATIDLLRTPRDLQRFEPLDMAVNNLVHKFLAYVRYINADYETDEKRVEAVVQLIIDEEAYRRQNTFPDYIVTCDAHGKHVYDKDTVATGIRTIYAVTSSDPARFEAMLTIGLKNGIYTELTHALDPEHAL